MIEKYIFELNTEIVKYYIMNIGQINVFISVQYLPMALYHVSHKYVDHPSSCTIRQTLCFLVFCDYLVTVRLWMQGCIDNLKQQLPSIQTFQVDDKNIFEFNSIQFI